MNFEKINLSNLFYDLNTLKIVVQQVATAYKFTSKHNIQQKWGDKDGNTGTLIQSKRRSHRAEYQCGQ